MLIMTTDDMGTKTMGDDCRRRWGDGDDENEDDGRWIFLCHAIVLFK